MWPEYLAEPWDTTQHPKLKTKSGIPSFFHFTVGLRVSSFSSCSSSSTSTRDRPISDAFRHIDCPRNNRWPWVAKSSRARRIHHRWKSRDERYRSAMRMTSRRHRYCHVKCAFRQIMQRIRFISRTCRYNFRDSRANSLFVVTWTHGKRLEVCSRNARKFKSLEYAKHRSCV